jgi:hypothetical protein
MDTTEVFEPEAPPVAPEPEDLIPEELTKDVLAMVERYCRPEQSVRLGQMAFWRKLENYWNGRQFLFYDSVARDYRDARDSVDDPEAQSDPFTYAKHVNIYKAHGESWIAALSAGLPYVRFFPDNADSPEDNSTAKAFTNLSKLIQQHNRAERLFMKALYTLFNCGVVFAYNDNRSANEFGTIKVPQYEQGERTKRTTVCPSCGHMFGETEVQPGEPPPQPTQCPQCMQPVEPDFEDIPEPYEEVTGYEDKPKSREIIEVYSPLYVQIPHWVTKLRSTPYLRLDTEEPIAMVYEAYPEFASKISESYDSESRQRWARTNRQYRGQEVEGLVTRSRMWLRPWAYNILGLADNAEKIESLKQQFPDGLYVVIINDNLIVEVLNDNLDDHWTATESPFGEHLHGEPSGSQLIPVQDMVNELMNLTLENIEFSIPETFADPAVLDFDTYKNSEARPGMVYPAKAPSGQNLSSGFHEIKTATLSQEVANFANRLDQAGQFVLGTYPTIYGGSLEGGSGTAREYELSRQQALQRLSTSWVIVKSWWAQVMTKAVRSFVKNMQSEAEKMVVPQGSSFINVWIRKADLQGSVANIEPETSENFPISWSQRRDVIMQLMGMKDEHIGSILQHPANAAMIKDIIGLQDMYLPGDDDRNKQLEEISELLAAEPIPMGVNPETGQEEFQSSVSVDPDIDLHEVEAETCMAWLRSAVGTDARKTNPAGWMNVRSHMMEHQQIVQQRMMEAQMMAAMTQSQGQPPDNGGSSENSEGEL